MIVTISKAHRIVNELMKFISSIETKSRYNRQQQINMSAIKPCYLPNSVELDIEEQCKQVAELINSYQSEVKLNLDNAMKAIKMVSTIRGWIDEYNHSTRSMNGNQYVISDLLNRNVCLKNQIRLIKNGVDEDLDTTNLREFEELELAISGVCRTFAKYHSPRDTSYVENTSTISKINADTASVYKEVLLLNMRKLKDNEELISILNGSGTIDVPTDMWEWMVSRSIV